jgi:PAS domain S-box-containing protein
LEPQNSTAILTRLKALGAICAESTSDRPLDDVLQNIVAQMVRVASVDHATIALLDDKREFFEVKHEYPVTRGGLILGQRITVEGRPCQEAIRNGQLVIANAPLTEHAIYKESAEFAEIAKRIGIRSLLIVPIASAGRVLGTISVDSTVGLQFSEADQEMYRMVAQHAAIAIQNALVLQREQVERQRAEAARKLAEELGVHAGLEGVATSFLHELYLQFGFDTASFQLVTGERRTLLAGLGFDTSKVNPAHLRPTSQDKLMERVLRGREPLIIPDTAVLGLENWGEGLAEGAVNSWAAVPILIDGSPRAIVTMDHRQRGFFHKSQKADMAACVQQVAPAIRRAAEFAQAQEERRVLVLVNTFAETVGENFETDDLIRIVLSDLHNELKCDFCTIHFLEKSGESEALVPYEKLKDAALPLWASEAVSCNERSPLWEAFVSNSSVMVDSIHIDRAFDGHHEYSSPPVALVAAPIRAGARAIGVLAAFRTARGAFGERDKMFIASLALQLGLGKARNDRFALLHEIGNQIIKAQTMGTVLERIVQGAIRLTNMSTGVIHVLNEDGSEVDDTFHSDGFEHPAPRMNDPNSVTRQVLSQKRTLEFADTHEHACVNALVRARWRSMIAVPLLLEERVVGVLFLNDNTVRKYTASDKTLLETLAGQAAIIIERTRTHQLFRAIVDEIPATVYRKDSLLRFTYGNRQLFAELGAADSVLGRRDEDFFEPDHAEKYKADDLAVMSSAQPKDAEEPHRFADKPDHWVRVLKQPVLDNKGRVLGVQGIYWDITEAKRDRDRYASLVDQSPDAIVVHSGGRIGLANGAAAQLFGVARADELIGKNIIKLIHPDDRDLAQHRLEQLQTGEQVDIAELRVQAREGMEPTVVQAHARPLETDGEIQVVFHDVTRVRTLLLEMHHRVVRCLNTVDNRIKLLKGGLAGDAASERALRALNSLEGQVHAMSTVHWSLKRTGNESLVEMGEYLKALVDSLGKSYLSNGEHVSFQVAAERIQADHKLGSRVGAIVAELVGNSLVHAQRGRETIRIRVDLAERAGQGLGLVVEDDGPGMSMQPLSRGLGLTVVQLLVEEVRGQSKYSNSDGLRWEILLPARKVDDGWQQNVRVS